MQRATAQALALVRVVVDELDRLADRLDLLGVLVADLHVELLFQRHDHLDQIERVGVQIIREPGRWDDFALINAKLLGVVGEEVQP